MDHFVQMACSSFEVYSTFATPDDFSLNSLSLQPQSSTTAYRHRRLSPAVTHGAPSTKFVLVFSFSPSPLFNYRVRHDVSTNFAPNTKTTQLYGCGNTHKHHPTHNFFLFVLLFRRKIESSQFLKEVASEIPFSQYLHKCRDLESIYHNHIPTFLCFHD
ncbi:hypothetical protein JHK86_042870 [Glycine max]|uniref:Uncharacterized protein n=1 Tax=Glycine max TaxID=3847 RepID=A0A0R0GBL2_SOYBN|nr:hypothetical protein JHK86_042870 [Glycine max]